jgi:erythromycin esterase
MVGSARVVGLGEGTHGTREFFLLKHRLLEFLVSEMGFTHFAIEATWPESNDVNRYVLTGEGDPAKLLANLYFWTWNTQEVLDLIKWMRRWNETALADRRVQFVGFDMQFPGAAMDTVTEFVQRVDPTSLSYVGGRYACLALYRNHGRVFIRSAAQYGALSAPQKDACKTGLHEVLAFIDDRQASFEAASSRAKYSNVRQSARLVQQFEEMASSSSTASLVRDKAMAENTQWLLDQAGPSARMVLWAHNYHVSNLPTSMGGYLRRTWGASYVNLGFLFGSGSFNAYGVNAPLREWSSALVPAWSLEAAFLATARPIALFDARTVLTGGAPGEPLRGPIPMRSVGAFFDQTRESAYYGSTVLPGDFDLLLFVATTSASSLLPFP